MNEFRLLHMGTKFLARTASKHIAKSSILLAMVLILGSATGSTDPVPIAFPDHPFDGKLSVLTYTVKGLPWPLAKDRAAALRKIASRLSALRRNGQHPEIILLQEAFTGEAKSIGRLSGYQYIAEGPNAGSQSMFTTTQQDRKFAANGSLLKGENIGKYINSGLQILSDFPITAIHKTSFPENACAGFDCLASKGVMLVDVHILPLDATVQIGNIHMNSKRHSYASMERRITAYRRQVDATYEFYQIYRDTRYPIIFGGDFNPGTMKQRQNALFSKHWPIQKGNDALRQLAQKQTLSSDAQAALNRAADWQFSEVGDFHSMRAERVEVSFGTKEPDGPLSDHIGYTIDYVVE